MLVDSPSREVEKPFTNKWENMLVPRDVIIRGYWYKKLRPGSKTYHLRSDKPLAHIVLSSILAYKFQMPPTLNSMRGPMATYELSVEALHQISEALDQVTLLDTD